MLRLGPMSNNRSIAVAWTARGQLILCFCRLSLRRPRPGREGMVEREHGTGRAWYGRRSRQLDRRAQLGWNALGHAAVMVTTRGRVPPPQAE